VDLHNPVHGWLLFGGVIGAVLLVQGLWNAVGFMRYWRRQRRLEAELRSEIASRRGTLEDALMVGPFTFSRWKLLDALAARSLINRSDQRLIATLLERRAPESPWRLLDGLEWMHHRAPTGGPVPDAGRYVLSFTCAECGQHPGHALAGVHHTNGHAGTVRLSCPNGHLLLKRNWISRANRSVAAATETSS
jgi:hypothetical protein